VTSQLNFFDGAGDSPATTSNFPQGLRYRPELIGREEEAALVARSLSLPFREFEFHDYTGKRRTVSFGRHYDFTGHQLRKSGHWP